MVRLSSYNGELGKKIQDNDISKKSTETKAVKRPIIHILIKGALLVDHPNTFKSSASPRL